MKSSGKLVFLDLETTGTDHKRHKVIQFAGAAVDAVSLEVLEEVDVKQRIDLGDPTTWSQAAMVMHARRTVDVDVELQDDEAIARFVDYWNLEAERQVRETKMGPLARVKGFLERHKTVQCTSKRPPFRSYSVVRPAGHNIHTFDLPFLREWYGTSFCPVSFKSLDTLGWAGILDYLTDGGQCDEGRRLEDLAALYGIHVDTSALHDALADVRLNVEVFRAQREHALDIVARTKMAWPQ